MTDAQLEAIIKEIAQAEDAEWVPVRSEPAEVLTLADLRQEIDQGLERAGKDGDVDLEPLVNGEAQIRCPGAGIHSKAVDLDARTVTFVVSDESVDRDGDILRAEGWDLSNYRKNPVVLWAHQHRMPPVAKAPDIAVRGKRLEATAEFYDGPGPLGEFSSEVLDMYAMGFLSATSVGFRPNTRPQVRRGPEDPESGYRPILGLEFIGQELMEFSTVPVPANPNALSRMAKTGAASKLFPKSWPLVGHQMGYTVSDAEPGGPSAKAVSEAKGLRAEALAEVNKRLDEMLARNAVAEYLNR